MEDKKKVIYIIVGVIVGLFLIWAVVQRGNNNSPSSYDSNLYSQEGFKNMLEKDPSDWTQQEKDYYNDFSEWSDEN